MALRNSVVLGTSANNVNPRNFSSILPDPRTTSTVSTKISTSATQIQGTHTSNNSIQNSRTKQNHTTFCPRPIRRIMTAPSNNRFWMIIPLRRMTPHFLRTTSQSQSSDLACRRNPRGRLRRRGLRVMNCERGRSSRDFRDVSHERDALVTSQGRA